MMVVVGADSFGRALLARRDVRPTQYGLIAARMLGMASERRPAQGGLVAGAHGWTGGVAFVLNVEVVDLVFIIPRDIAGHLRALELFRVRCQDGRLDLLTAHRVDRMSDVGMQLGSPVGVAQRAVFVESASALI